MLMPSRTITVCTVYVVVTPVQANQAFGEQQSNMVLPCHRLELQGVTPQKQLWFRAALTHRRVLYYGEVPHDGLVCQLELENWQQDRKHNLCN